MDEKEEPQIVNLMDALKASIAIEGRVPIAWSHPERDSSFAITKAALHSPAVTALLEAVPVGRDLLISWRSLASSVAAWDKATEKQMRELGNRFEERIDALEAAAADVRKERGEA